MQVEGAQRDLVAFKRREKVIIADSFTLETVATTKRFNLRNVEQAIMERKVVTSRFAGKSFRRSKPGLDLNIVDRTPLTRKILETRNRPIRKEGRLVLNITFFKKGKRMTTEGFSRFRMFTIKGQKDIAFDEAFRMAIAKAGKQFYDFDDFVVNFIHYDYFIQKRGKKVVII